MNIPFARPFGRIADLCVVEALAVIEDLDFFHVRLELFGVQGLTGTDAHDAFDVVPLHGLVALNADLRNHRLLGNDKDNHLPFRDVRDLRGDVIEIAHFINGLDVVGKVRVGKDVSCLAPEDLLDGAGLDLAVSLEFDADDPFFGGDPGQDLRPELGQDRAQIFPPSALDEDSRQGFPLAKIDQSSIHADPLPEFGNTSRNGIEGAGLFPDRDDQGIVQRFPLDSGTDLRPRNQADGFRFEQFRRDSAIDGLTEARRLSR